MRPLLALLAMLAVLPSGCAVPSLFAPHGRVLTFGTTARFAPYEPDLRAALRAWNTAMGVEALRAGPDPADVMVDYDPSDSHFSLPVEEAPPGFYDATHHLITIRFPGSLLHEVGHAIGLNHVTDRISLMAPNYRLTAPTPLDAVLARHALGY